MSVVIAPAGMVVRPGFSADSARRFCVRVAELGGKVLEPVWLGVHRPHRVRCVAGHECSPRPGNVRSGQGICRICAGQDSAGAEARFRARVVELGGVVVEPVWLGSDRLHRCRCAAGHECSPRPANVGQGQGLCRTCVGHDPDAAWTVFRAAVEGAGGVVLEPVWLGSKVPHRVRCAAGHVVTPWPNAVDQGQGFCRVCAGRVWDWFYVVSHPCLLRLKLGITSGDPTDRLDDHRRVGYVDVIRSLAIEDGRALERACLSTLSLAGVRPLVGRREYFDLTAALPVVLDVVDNWPGVADG